MKAPIPDKTNKMIAAPVNESQSSDDELDIINWEHLELATPDMQVARIAYIIDTFYNKLEKLYQMKFCQSVERWLKKYYTSQASP